MIKTKSNIDKRIIKLLSNLKSRCDNINDIKYKFYGGKGIKNFLSLNDIIYLWNRDNASKMLQPSIDRKDGCKDYTIDNCQFIEMEENRNKKGIKHWDERNISYINTHKKMFCKRCGYYWNPRKKNIRMCPKCKSPYFDVKKK